MGRKKALGEMIGISAYRENGPLWCYYTPHPFSVLVSHPECPKKVRQWHDYIISEAEMATWEGVISNVPMSPFPSYLKWNMIYDRE